MDNDLWCNEYGCWCYEVEEVTEDTYTCHRDCVNCCMCEKVE
jgi:hypothetical protein